jgi:hypothetical protein
VVQSVPVRRPVTPADEVAISTVTFGPTVLLDPLPTVTPVVLVLMEPGVKEGW